MTPERWREIEQLYHAALERGADERQQYLDEACSGDQALRREVDSLFDSAARAQHFMEQPAAQLLTSAMRQAEQPSIPGRFVGRVFGGAYRVQALIAAGGMGEVYRALDLRLNRTVAVKTLPGHLSDHPKRRERFLREARIVSSLNHPHICTLHDVGVEDGVDYLVMEHIEGETLQKRLHSGSLPLARALEYSIQIVDALDKAHRKGVIHRDLKPGNVMLTKLGVKLLDFGLATREARAGIAFDDAGQDLSSKLTAAGAIVGTLQYISPEQLEGKPADSRADLFAFGALALEMITGRTAFQAANRAQLVGAILKDDPPSLDRSIPGLPPRLAPTLSRCLAKDPDDRWQSAGDLLFELQSIGGANVRSGSDAPPHRGLSRRVERALWAAAIIAVAAVALFSARNRGARTLIPPAATPPIRYTLFPASGTALDSRYGLPFAVSPDGRQVVYAATSADGTEQLWLRSLYADLEKPVPGTDGANTPFWSTDGEWIGFFAANSLKKVRVSSGLTQVVAPNVQTKGGASWNGENVIVFSTGPGGLARVSAAGGPVSAATTASEGSHFWPQFLADGQHFIYAAALTNSLDLASLGDDAPRILMKFPVRISALAYVPGYVFFVQDATLFARPFDEQRLGFSGEAVRVVDGIPVMATGRAPFSVSAAGVLAYWPTPVGTPSVLHWYERDGRASVAVATPAKYAGFAVAPDASQVAFSRAGASGGTDLWIRDLGQDHERQLTFDGAAFTPQWSPDGTRIAFSGPAEHPPVKLFVKGVGNAAAATRFGVSKTPNFASSWSGDGRSIVSVRIDPATRNDLWVHRLDDGVDERLPVNTSANEFHGRVSPDSQWIAYQSDAGGQSEVWVASFPSGAIQRQISVGGGIAPEWGRGSSEIVYVSDDKRMMSVTVSAVAGTVQVGAPRTLFEIRNMVDVDPAVFPTSNAYVTAANGERFLVAVRAGDPNPLPINIVVNWPALLKR